jgi:hypothetical protein
MIFPILGKKKCSFARSKVLLIPQCPPRGESWTTLSTVFTLNNSVFRTLSISAGKMKELQGQDNVLSQIIDYLENDNLPESQKEARRILLHDTIDCLVFLFETFRI